MNHHDSIPVELGRDRSLHIIQHKVRGGICGFFQTLSSTSGVIRVEEVAAGEQASLEISSDGNAPERVDDTKDDDRKSQKIVITVSQAYNMKIVLKAPKGSRLGHLHIESEDFKVDFDLQLDSSSSSSGVSDLFTSRETVVSTKSGSISGLIPSEELLNIASISGRVGLTLLPLHDTADGKRSKLHIKTVSGSVAVNKEIDPKSDSAWLHLPSGSCDFAIHTVSGSVYAVTGMPDVAAYKTVSGSLKLQALQSSENGPCELSTFTTSGSQAISVLESEHVAFALPLRNNNPGRAQDGKDKAYAVARAEVDAKEAEAADLPPAYTPSADSETVASEAPPSNTPATGDGGFTSSHRSTSGSIKIDYPLSWHGTLDAHFVSSSVTIEGGDVKVEKRSRSVHAVKGEPGDHTDIRNVSGSIKVLFA
ncbi:hypothetical protein NQ176_g2795 [Zarea fungicola]|uniref:Uncharacterized protein n=1 Tax=Zarea fungicola TaxID=93591 RepID=A0ACC1NMK0_9HYPO|nr:hypothetical protein NQ176_g2795 [Lecanicillium fungicola]